MLQPRDLKGRTAISYVRWSSGRQSDGDSLRRQTESAERFCAAHGLTLDRQVLDAATSGFTGSNLSLEAGLGRFIADVKAGTIPSDRVLILENLDRLSRINPMEIVTVFIDLLRTGLTLVTLSDGRVHTEAAYKANTMHLMMSLMSMQAAHEYSAKLSMRVRDEWANRTKRARQGRVKVSKVPFWIDQETQELNARQDHARLVFSLSKSGLGQRAVAAALNEQGIPSPSGQTWSKSSVQDTLANKAAYGSLVLKGDEVPNYYPPIVTETEWLALQSRSRSRAHNPQAANTANLFARLVYCGHCGSIMALSTTKVRGEQFRYMRCEGRVLKRKDCQAPNWRYETLEAEFLGRVGFLAIPVDPEAPEVDRTTELEDAIKALEAKHSNVLAGLADASDSNSRTVILGIAEGISKDMEAKRSELVRIRESVARHNDAASAVADIEADQKEIKRLAKEDRKEAQRLIANLVERIELETEGTGRVTPRTPQAFTVTLRTGRTYTAYLDPKEAEEEL